MKILPLCAALATLSSLPSVAQSHPVDGAPDEARLLDPALRRAVTWTQTDGRPLVEGAAFEAEFDALGLGFRPALGAGAPATRELRIEAAEVLREGSDPIALQAAKPRREGARVSYRRGPGIEERFDVSSHGVEQSFLLDAPPAGTGDLVVRCRLDGDLSAETATPDRGGLAFQDDGGGVHVGEVTGIDADGRRSEGELRVRDGFLELVLPAPFVDGASWPLLVDPLIGTVFTIEGSTLDDAAPDVAYDETTGFYLVVWNRTFSATDVRVRGQRVDAAGNLVGGTIFFGSGPDVVGRPRIASLNPVDRFLVVWVEDAGSFPAIQAQACDAGSGALSGVTLVRSLPFSTVNGFDVGGEARASLGTSDAVVVWHQSVLSEGIHSIPVSVPASGDPTVGTSTQLVVDVPPFGLTSDPSISSTGGALGQFLVAFRSLSILGTNFNIVGIALDRQGQPLTSAKTLVAVTEDEGVPAVDGGASLEAEFVVVYEQDVFGTTYELEATTVAIEGGELEVTGTSVLTSSALPFSDYDVTWTPGRASVVYVVPSTTTAAESVWVQDVDMADAAPCGTRELVGTFRPVTPFVQVAIASVASGGRPGLGEALIAFSYQTAMAAGNVLGQLHDSLFGGVTTDLGGGCGLGGSISPFGHPVIGNGYFQLTLVGADPTALVTVLNVTSPTSPIPCGPCNWLPLQAATTHAVLGGASQVILSIPCEPSLVGQLYEAQFTTLTPGTSPCPLVQNVSVSDRLQVQIGG